jgi:hypothetical protein
MTQHAVPRCPSLLYHLLRSINISFSAAPKLRAKLAAAATETCTDSTVDVGLLGLTYILALSPPRWKLFLAQGEGASLGASSSPPEIAFIAAHRPLSAVLDFCLVTTYNTFASSNRYRA